MTTEELMKPRYKVIADYPSMPMKLNSIITYGSPHYIKQYIIRSAGSLDDLHVKYPKIFRLMSWWEERDVKDMPEYVKSEAEVEEYKKWIDNLNHYTLWNDTAFDQKFVDYLKSFLPATESDYNTFIKKTKQ